MDKLTSIIIPCYNAQETVIRAVVSALSQTYENTEVIAVDDGSTDDTLQLLNKFSDKVKIISGPNRGGAFARNLGLGVAEGEFIQFLDADDELAPGKLRACADAVVALGGGVIPVTDWRRVRANGTSADEEHSLPNDRPQLLVDIVRIQIQTAAPMHTKSALTRVGGFREDLACCQEYDLHLRLAASGCSFGRVNYQGVVVHETLGSVSSNNARILRQKVEVLSNFLRLLPDGIDTDKIKTVVANDATQSAFDAAGLGEMDVATNFLKLAEANATRSRTKPPTGLVSSVLFNLLGPSAALSAYSTLKKSLSTK